MDVLYKDEEVDVAFVMRCSTDLTSLCIHQHHLFMRFPDECYMVGISEYILNVLVNGRTQPATWSASFANLKAFALLRGKRSKNITFFLMTKWPLSNGAQIIEDRWKGSTSLNLTQYLGKTPSSTWFPGQCRWHANGKATFPRNYGCYCPQIWDPSQSGKETIFMWSIWHKAVAVYEWSARIALASISKQ